MEYNEVQKTDLRECLSALMKNRNKGISFDEWKNKKNFETYKLAEMHQVESCLFNSFDQIVRNANKNSRLDWLKIKNAQAKKTYAKQKMEDICLKKGENEFEALQKKRSKKAFNSWLRMKKKETKEKDLRIKKDEACSNLFDNYFFLVKSKYNKKAVKDWLNYSKERQNNNLYSCNCCLI